MVLFIEQNINTLSVKQSYEDASLLGLNWTQLP